MGMLNDLRYAWRLLRKSPAFAVTAFVSLAAGIAATTTTFALARGVLWRPLPFEQADRLVVVWETDEKHGFTNRNEASFANFLAWGDDAGSFDHLTALAHRSLNLTGAGDPERLMGAAPSVDFFEMLGVRAALGRTFTRDEEHPAAPPTVILSYGLWTRRFGRDPAVVGRQIALSGVPTTVIGVLPPDFRFEFPTRQDIDVWVPRVVSPQARQARRSRGLYVVGRLRPDATIESAQARLESIAARLAAAYPATNGGWSVRVLPLRDQIAGSARTPLLVLFASGVCLLLIVCANLATLLLSRSSARQAEMAVRTAIGASAPRLVRQVLVESALLAAAGAIAGAIASQIAIAGVRAGFVTIDLPRLHELRLDPVVLLFAFAVAGISALAFGFVQARQALTADPSAAIHGSLAQRTTSGGAKQTVLAGAEVAIAVMLLIAGALLFQTVSRLERVDPGFDPRDVVTFQLSLPPATYADNRAIGGFFDAAMAAIEAIPGVESAGAVTNLPLGGSNGSTSFSVEGRVEPSARLPEVDFRAATTNYFAAMKMRRLAGRLFEARDGADTPLVAVVNESMAREQWPGEDPIGRRVQFGRANPAQPWITIVGIVGDVHHSALNRPPHPEIYVPQAQYPNSFMYVAVRASVGNDRLLTAIAERIRGLDATLPIFRVQTMAHLVDEATAASRLSARLIGLFAGCALLLSVAGTYGLVAYAMSRRAREIGVRLALGAQRADVMRIVMRRGAVATIAGAAVGVCGAFAVMRVLQSMLFGVDVHDPATFVAAPALLTAVALMASAVPAWRAARMDPASVLKAE